MKPQIFTDEYYATNTWQDYEQRGHIAWETLGIWLVALTLVTLFWMQVWSLLFSPHADFTDPGVGCIEDCLDPAIEDEAQPVTSQRRIEG